MLQDYVLQLRLCPSIESVLQAFINVDVTNDAITAFLDQNPFYTSLLLKFVDPEGARLSKQPKKTASPDAKAKKSQAAAAMKEPISAHRAIQLLGMVGARNHLVVFHYLRRFQTPLLQDAKKGLQITPSTILKFALQAEEFATKHSLESPDLAFAAGLTLDWILGLEAKKLNRKSAATPGDQEIFSLSLKRGALLHCLTAQFSGFGFHRYSFSAGILHQAGKFILARGSGQSDSSISWAAFQKVLEKSPEALLDLSYLLERRCFAVDHAELSGLCCRFIPFFKPIEKAIWFYPEPYMLKGASRDQRVFAVLIQIANSVERKLRKGAAVNDGLKLLDADQLKWAQAIQLTEAQFIKALNQFKESKI